MTFDLNFLEMLNTFPLSNSDKQKLTDGISGWSYGFNAALFAIFDPIPQYLTFSEILNTLTASLFVVTFAFGLSGSNFQNSLPRSTAGAYQTPQRQGTLLKGWSLG